MCRIPASPASALPASLVWPPAACIDIASCGRPLPAVTRHRGTHLAPPSLCGMLLSHLIVPPTPSPTSMRRVQAPVCRVRIAIPFRHIDADHQFVCHLLLHGSIPYVSRRPRPCVCHCLQQRPGPPPKEGRRLFPGLTRNPRRRCCPRSCCGPRPEAQQETASFIHY